MDLMRLLGGFSGTPFNQTSAGSTPPVGMGMTDEEAIRLSQQDLPITAPIQAAQPTKPLETPTPVSIPDRLDNTNILQALQGQAANSPQHKGMFGTKGTLRDILGLFGDAFLVNAGRDRIYEPQRQRERLGDALAGMTDGPAAYRAAIERATQVDPNFSGKLFDDYNSQMLRQAQLDDISAERKSKIGDRRYKTRTELANQASRLLERAKTPEQIAYVRQLMAARAAQEDLTLEDLGIEEGMTPEQAGIYAAGDMTVNQQRVDDFRQKRLEEVEKPNAQSRRIQATRPRAGPRPPQRGMSQVDAEVADAVFSGRASPEQKRYYNDRILGKGKKGGRRGPPQSLPPGWEGATVRKVN